MTEFERLYNEKKGTLEDCLKAIHSYSRVCFAGDGNQPNLILSNLHKIAPFVEEVHCIKGHAGNFQCVTDPAMNGHISFTTFTNYDQLPLFLNANTVAQVLGVSISSAYELMHETGFPALRIGNRIVVPKEKFHQWVDAQTGGDA